MQQINNFKTLEFDIVLEHTAAETLSPVGRKLILNLPFLKDADQLKKELSIVEEVRDLLAFDEPIPLESFDDLTPSYENAEIEGAYLQPETFLSIRQFLGMVSQVVRYLNTREEKCPGLIKKLGARAREDVLSRYTWKKRGAQLSALCESVVNGSIQHS